MGRALVLFSLLFAFAGPGMGQPTLTLFQDRIEVEGISASGDLVLFGAAREGLGYFNRVRFTREILSADLTGHAELTLERELAPRSVWAVVDLSTGEYALASPRLEGPNEKPLPAEAFISGDTGEVEAVRFDHRVAEALVARAGKDEAPRGVWSVRLADGDPATDADGTFNRSVTLEVAALQPLLGEAAAESFEPGDVVLMIDPDTLEVSVARLGAEAGQGGER